MVIYRNTSDYCNVLFGESVDQFSEQCVLTFGNLIWYIMIFVLMIWLVKNILGDLF